jgi:hypothetical protein
VVCELGVAGRDVSGRPLTEAEPPEQAERGREALLTVPAFVLGVVEAGKRVRNPIRWHKPSLRAFVPVSP